MITPLSRRVWLNKKFSLALFKEHHYLVDSEQYEACDGEQVYVSLDDVPLTQSIMKVMTFILAEMETYRILTIMCVLTIILLSCTRSMIVK